MSTDSYEFPNGVLLTVDWSDCEAGCENDELIFEYVGSIAGLAEIGLPADAIEKEYSQRGRPKGLKFRRRVDQHGDRIRVVERRKTTVRVLVYKPLEHALRVPPFAAAGPDFESSAEQLLERFVRGPAAAP
jgi:hypothetical protein